MGSVYIVPRVTKTKGNRFQVRYEENGRSIQLGVFPTSKLAEVRKAHALVEMSQGKIPTQAKLEPRVPKRVLSTIADTWISLRDDLHDNTLRTYQTSVNTIKASKLGKMDPGKITPEDVQAWHQSMTAAGLRSGTVNKYLKHLNAILEYARVSPNPVQDKFLFRPKKDPRPVHVPTFAEIDLWVGALSKRYHDAFWFLYLTGARIEECCTIRNSYWYPGEGVGVDGKGGRWRVVPATDEMPIVFPKELGHSDHYTFGITDKQFSKMLLTARTKANLPPVTAHSLRYRRASSLMYRSSGTMGTAAIAEYLGHSVPTLLSTYTKRVAPETQAHPDSFLRYLEAQASL